MEFELDDVILVIDRSNKNNMDFYLLDEEFDEIKGMKIVMIILGVEDYVLISLFEEVSKEIKVILLMLILNIQVRKFKVLDEKDGKFFFDEIKKVDIFKEGNVRKGSGFDKLIDKVSFKKDKMEMILDKVDKYVK